MNPTWNLSTKVITRQSIAWQNWNCAKTYSCEFIARIFCTSGKYKEPMQKWFLSETLGSCFHGQIFPGCLIIWARKKGVRTIINFRQLEEFNFITLFKLNKLLKIVWNIFSRNTSSPERFFPLLYLSVTNLCAEFFIKDHLLVKKIKGSTCNVSPLFYIPNGRNIKLSH